MTDALTRLEPRPVWEHFSRLAAIPRPSGHEQRVVAWVRSLAAERGWEVRSDRVGNLVLAVPATPGHERAPVTILQGHLDMVCEKNADVAHDFMRDPIRPRVVDDWVHASGTTLGADNGVGVAAALAAATDPATVHGPLELLFTLDEETGLTGAQGLDGSLLRGRLLINLDSEEDGKLFVGCAGGADCRLHLEVARRPPAAETRAFRIEVRGLRGGHSGLNIHENRGNALKLVTRVLLAAADSGIALELADLHGGSKHNAIPREAAATLHLAPAHGPWLAELVEQLRLEFRRELAGIDEGLELRCSAVEAPAALVVPAAETTRLLDLLAAVPHGVLGMSPAVPGLVETSNNLAVVNPGDGGFEVVASARSSVGSLLEAVLVGLRSVARLAGARAEIKNHYPGWKPDLDSHALAVVRRAWTELYGEPEITAVHAGLECGLLGEKVPGLDMISFGPQIEGAHSPDERVQISSVSRFWQALCRTLGELARS